jgi:hypothetical protein
MQLETSAASAFNIVVQLEFYDMYGQLCFVANNSVSNHAIPKMSGHQTAECHLPKFPLNTGLYFINAAIYASNQLADEIMSVMEIEVEPGPFYQTGILPPAHKGFLVDYSWK